MRLKSRLSQNPMTFSDLVPSHEFASFGKTGCEPGMSRRGNRFDNAVIESFFGLLKAKYYDLALADGIAALGAGVNDYIRY